MEWTPSLEPLHYWYVRDPACGILKGAHICLFLRNIPHGGLGWVGSILVAIGGDKPPGVGRKYAWPDTLACCGALAPQWQPNILGVLQPRVRRGCCLVCALLWKK